jgi:hypothetical protein
MIEGDCSSNARSRSICVLNLAGSSGSGFSDARILSPISRTMARLCVWSMSTRLGITKPRSGKKAPAADTRRCAYLPLPQLFPLASTAGNSEWNRRPPLLAICASACFENSGSLVATFGYPRYAPGCYQRATVSWRLNSWRQQSFLVSDRGAVRTDEELVKSVEFGNRRHSQTRPIGLLPFVRTTARAVHQASRTRETATARQNYLPTCRARCDWLSSGAEEYRPLL